MTKHELSQLYYLTREITQYKEKLSELESRGFQTALTGGGRLNRISDPTGTLAVKVAEYKEMIKDKYLELVEKQIAAENYISSLEDVQLRLVMRLRFIELQSWIKIARAMGSYNEATPRRMVDRFFEGN